MLLDYIQNETSKSSLAVFQKERKKNNIRSHDIGERNLYSIPILASLHDCLASISSHIARIMTNLHPLSVFPWFLLVLMKTMSFYQVWGELGEPYLRLSSLRIYIYIYHLMLFVSVRIFHTFFRFFQCQPADYLLLFLFHVPSERSGINSDTNSVVNIEHTLRSTHSAHVEIQLRGHSSRYSVRFDSNCDPHAFVDSGVVLLGGFLCFGIVSIT